MRVSRLFRRIFTFFGILLDDDAVCHDQILVAHCPDFLLDMALEGPLRGQGLQSPAEMQIYFEHLGHIMFYSFSVFFNFLIFQFFG